MLSSRNGSSGDGTYQELQDDHLAHQHELSNMNMEVNNKLHGSDSDHLATAESITTATTQKPEAPHPRKDLPNWKWQGTLAVCFLTSLVNGTFEPATITLALLHLLLFLGSLLGGLDMHMQVSALKTGGLPSLSAFLACCSLPTASHPTHFTHSPTA